MRVALDTNILAYVSGLIRSSADPAKVEQARDMIDRLIAEHELIVPTQVLGELFNAMTKGGLDRSEAREIVDLADKRYIIAVGTQDCFRHALDLAVDHKMQIWDSLILCTAAAADCTVLLSEDMQDGFTTRGVTIANPFLPRLQPVLARLVGD